MKNLLFVGPNVNTKPIHLITDVLKDNKINVHPIEGVDEAKKKLRHQQFDAAVIECAMKPGNWFKNKTQNYGLDTGKCFALELKNIQHIPTLFWTNPHLNSFNPELKEIGKVIYNTYTQKKIVKEICDSLDLKVNQIVYPNKYDEYKKANIDYAINEIDTLLEMSVEDLLVLEYDYLYQMFQPVEIICKGLFKNKENISHLYKVFSILSSELHEKRVKYLADVLRRRLEQEISYDVLVKKDLRSMPNDLYSNPAYQYYLKLKPEFLKKNWGKYLLIHNDEFFLDEDEDKLFTQAWDSNFDPDQTFMTKIGDDKTPQVEHWYSIRQVAKTV